MAKDSTEQRGRRRLLELTGHFDAYLDDLREQNPKRVVNEVITRGKFNKDGFERVVIIDNELFTITVKRGGTLG